MKASQQGSGTRVLTSNPCSVTFKALRFGAHFFTWLCSFLACRIEMTLPTTSSNLGLTEKRF